jgi:hypothetical protein
MRVCQIISIIATFVLTLPTQSHAQLSGSVGPTTTTASKAAKKICNVLDYGAKADKTSDLGPPLALAFAACKTGGIGKHENSSYGYRLTSFSMGSTRRLWNVNLADFQWWLWLGAPTRWSDIQDWDCRRAHDYCAESY